MHNCDPVRRRKLCCCSFRRVRFFSRVSTFCCELMQSLRNVNHVTVCIICTHCSLPLLLCATRLLHPSFVKGTTRTLGQTTATFSSTTCLQARPLYAHGQVIPLLAVLSHTFTGNELEMTARAPIASRTPTVAVFEYLIFTRMRFKATRIVICVLSRLILTCTLLLLLLHYFFLSLFQHSPRLDIIFNSNNLLEQQKELVVRLSPDAALSPSCDVPQSSESPRTLTFLLKRDGHLNNFHCAGTAICSFSSSFFFLRAVRCVSFGMHPSIVLVN